MPKYFNPLNTNYTLTLLNPVLHTDSYKMSHRAMEVEGTELIYSNLTPRSTKYFDKVYPNHDGKVVFFGLQAFILKELIHNWNVGFFHRDHDEVMAEIAGVLTPYIGMENLEHFSELHKLQYLPLHIKALDEGTKVSAGIPVLTVVNTHPEFSWLTNYIESVMSAELWKPITVATVARELSRLRDKYFNTTVSDHTFKEFAIHDFSYRGHSTSDSAALCGAAALLFSNGTDNVPAVTLAKTIYGAKDDVAGSVPASEHSVTTLGINHFSTQAVKDVELLSYSKMLKDKLKEINAESEYDQAWGELVTLHRMITKIYPEGIMSYVADSYDYWRVLTIILPILKDVIEARSGKLVIRPDSSDPVDMVVGESCRWVILKTEDQLNDFMVSAEDGQKFIYEDKAYEVAGMEDYVLEYGPESLSQCGHYTDISALINSCHILTEIKNLDTTAPAWKGSISVLEEIFGSTTNSKGYKELAPCIGLIYGDGITYQRAEAIYSGLKAKKYAANNVIFGIGSFSFAHLSRDTLGMAIKATSAIVNEQPVAIYKDPKTDSGKKSAKGFLVVEKNSKGKLVLKDNCEFYQENTGLLRTVFINGQAPYLQTFDEIKMLARQ